MNDVLFSTGRSACRFAKRFSTTSAAVLLAAFAALQPSESQAVPYATSLTNDGSNISFRLNESADSVRIIHNGGASTEDLGARAAGLHVVPLTVTGTFEISVFKSSPIGFSAPIGPNQGGILRISNDGVTTRFRDPRGLAINTDPASPNFGRVYVAHSTNGTVAANAFGPARTLTDGIYLMNADLSDAVGQGDVARNAGINFITGGAAGDTVSPYRLSVGQDGNLYIADWSDTGGTLWQADASMSPGTGANVLGGPIGGPFPVTATRYHGSIAAAIVEGTLGAGNLTSFVIDEDLQNDRAATGRTMQNTLWRHDIGATLPGPEVLPTRIGTTTPWIGFASQTMDLSRGTNGNFYVNDYRSTGNDRGGLYVLDSAGVELWNSLAATRTLLGGSPNDLLRATGGGSVSPAGDFAAVINLETNAITVLPLLNGIPDITNRLVIHGFGIITAQGRDVAFDLAGNLYAISSGAQSLRVFSPGGTTTAITGSDGTFRLNRPTGLTVTVADDVATEGAADTAAFTLTRDGDTSADLVVNYILTGTAVNGTDFENNLLTATIPAGEASVNVVITAIDDSETELVETVTLTLTPTANYDVKSPLTATLGIADNEPATVTIHPVDGSTYERFATDLLTFRLQRSGETNSELFVVFEPSNGTAINGADFVGQDGQPISGIVILTAGQSTSIVTAIPVDDAEPEGTETVTMTLNTDPGYTLGDPASATGFIADNDQPDFGVLYTNPLDTDDSANWITRFGANNSIFDAEVKWAFDYSALGIPPAPASLGSSVGVLVQVNKTNSTAAGSAGINLYPASATFSGNYALRFDMFLQVGGGSTTEHALAGLNHSTLFTNRATQSADANATVRGGDGVFAGIASDASNLRDWAAYTFLGATNAVSVLTNRAASTLTASLPAPPYSFAGSPGITSNSVTKTWTEIELSQSNNVVTLKANNNHIFSVPNTTPYKSGAFMLGMNDQFDSVGGGGNTGILVIYDNVRVVSLDVRITHTVRLPNGDVQIDFLSPYGGAASTYKVERASNLTIGNWSDDNTAVITATDSGYRAVIPANGTESFYRIKR